MGLLAKLFRKKTGKETESAVKLLVKWEDAHFRPVGEADGKQAEPNPERYLQFICETGERMTLSKIRLPIAEPTPPPEGLFGIIKAFISPLQPSMLPALIVRYRSRFAQEIRNFRGNMLRLPQLGDSLREDTLFEEIDRVFSEKLRLLYHELMFCRPEQMCDLSYYYTVTGKLDRILSDLSELNRNAEAYMYALVSTEHGDTAHSLEMIRMRVTAMADTVREIGKQ